MSTVTPAAWPTGPEVADHLERGLTVRFIGDPRPGATHPPSCSRVPDDFGADSQHLHVWRLLESEQPGYELIDALWKNEEDAS